MVDIEKTYQWPEKAGLRDSTEALIMVEQERALTLKQVGVYHTRQDPKCP